MRKLFGYDSEEDQDKMAEELHHFLYTKIGKGVADKAVYLYLKHVGPGVEHYVKELKRKYGCGDHIYRTGYLDDNLYRECINCHHRQVILLDEIEEKWREGGMNDRPPCSPPMLVWGHRYGLRIDRHIGPWLSLGIHTHFWPPQESHIDFHMGWLIITIGRHYG